jgi:hypothetical protein
VPWPGVGLAAKRVNNFALDSNHDGSSGFAFLRSWGCGEKENESAQISQQLGGCGPRPGSSRWLGLGEWVAGNWQSLILH